MVSVEDVTQRLEGFKDTLKIEAEGNWIIVRATKWLSPEDYAKINTLIREFNGERIQAGKMSHWRINVSHAIVGSHVNVRDRLIQLREQIDKIIQEMK